MRVLCRCCKKYWIEDDVHDICVVCGWEDDPVQNDDEDWEGGANNLSLREYRKRVNELFKKNPNWQYDFENKDDMRYLGVIE